MTDATLQDGEELSAEETARVRAAFDAVPFAALLGMELIGARRGEAAFALEMRPELTRMEGIMHGGALASLLDTAAAFAVHTLLPAGGRTVTVELSVHYLRPVSAGRIEARARVLREGRRIVILSVEATDERGRLVADATTTYVKQM